MRPRPVPFAMGFLFYPGLSSQVPFPLICVLYSFSLSTVSKRSLIMFMGVIITAVDSIEKTGAPFGRSFIMTRRPGEQNYKLSDYLLPRSKCGQKCNSINVSG